MNIVCKESNNPTLCILPKIWKIYFYCLGFTLEALHKDFTVFGCQSKVSAENSKRVEEAHWWLQRYGSTKASLWSFSQKKKKTPEFIDEIQVIIDNDPIMSIGTIARDMTVSVFLIQLVVHEDIVSYKTRKTQFLSQARKERPRCKFFQQIQASLPTKLIVMKTKHQGPHRGMRGAFIFSYIFALNTEAYIKYPEDPVQSWIE